MSAKGRTRQFTTEPGEEMRDRVISEPDAFFEIKPGHEKELAAVSQQFAAVLRTLPVEETSRTGLRDFGHVLFSGDKRPLWTMTFESDWHRYIGKRILRARTTH